MNLIGWVKCWWYQRHVPMNFKYFSGYRQLCIRCGKTIK